MPGGYNDDDENEDDYEDEDDDEDFIPRFSMAGRGMRGMTSEDTSLKKIKSVRGEEGKLHLQVSSLIGMLADSLRTVDYH